MKQMTFIASLFGYYSDSYKPQADEARGTSCPSKTCRIRSHRPSLRQR